MSPRQPPPPANHLLNARPPPRGLSIRLHLSSPPPCPHPHQYSIHTPSCGAVSSRLLRPCCFMSLHTVPSRCGPFYQKRQTFSPPPIKNTWRMSDREVALVGKWSRFLSSQGGGERRKRVFLTVLMADVLVSVKLDPTFDLCHVSVNPITVRCWWKWFCRKKGMWKDREERNMRRGAGSSGWENVWGFSGVCLPPHHNTVVSFKCVSVCVCVCVCVRALLCTLASWRGVDQLHYAWWNLA